MTIHHESPTETITRLRADKAHLRHLLRELRQDVHNLVMDLATEQQRTHHAVAGRCKAEHRVRVERAKAKILCREMKRLRDGKVGRDVT